MMNNIVTSFILGCFLVTSVTLDAQQVVEHFRSASFDRIFDHMAPNVDYQSDEGTVQLDREEAIRVLRNKYRSFQPVRWEVVHTGKAEAEGAQYHILKMFDADDNGMRLFIHTEGPAGRKRITAIKFRRLL